MSFEKYAEYAEKTSSTAVYEDDFYPFLGLAGELGEYMRDSKAAELGDVLWYAAQCLRSIRGSAEAPLLFAGIVSTARDSRVSFSSLSDYGHYRNLMVMLDVAAAIEVCKKNIRAKTALIEASEEHFDILMHAVISAITYVCEHCNNTGVDLIGLMADNLHKLAERKRTNTIVEHD